MTRVEFLQGLIGNRWEANARGPDRWDCFHLMKHIELHLGGRDVGELEMPNNPTWAWMVDAVERHPARKQWREVPPARMGLVVAGDLSVVLMARRKNPAHVGVWLKPEATVIHADQDLGVVCDGLIDLHMKGWQRLRFYEPS